MAVAPLDNDSESDSASVASSCYSDPGEDVCDMYASFTTLEISLSGPSSEPTVVRKHPALHTEFIGVRHRNSTPGAEVHQFRGIKYASVPMRFRRSVLFHSFASTTDATKYGPISPQIKNRWLESRLYALPRDVIPAPTHVPTQSEFECLNLTITAPAPSSCARNCPLPVMVWIHGGGNVTGSSTDWIWDAGALVHKSVQIGRPVIIVAINYRLGLFGFGASELLREDNAAAGEEGVGNYGLHDQRAAFQWIRNYIDGFGGDPHNVTLFGSSWGAADIHAHLLSTANHADVTAAPDQEGPLFHRAILQSGALVPSSSVVQDVACAGQHFGRIMSALHVSTIEQLRAVPAAKLVAATGERVRPVDDGVFLRPDWRSLTLPFSTAPNVPMHWRQDVIIGDVACESVLWATPARMWAADAVARRARAIVQSVRRADALMRAYDIVDTEKTGCVSPTREAPVILSDPALEDDEDESISSGSEEAECAERVMELMNDVAFAWPVDVAARCAADSAFVFEELLPLSVSGDGYLSSVSESDSDPSPSTSDVTLMPTRSSRPKNAPYVYRYVFDQASPYTGSPHHGVDMLYLFGNIPFPSDPEFTPEENDEVNWDRVKVREEVQERWLAFAHGEQPWDALTPQPPAGVASMSDRGIFATPMLSPVSSFSPHGLVPSPTSTSPVSSRAPSFSSAFGSANLFAHMHRESREHQLQVQVQHQCQLSHQHKLQHQHKHALHLAHHRHHHAPPGGQLCGPAHMPPISISAADKVFVFGPEGETGTRSARIFAGRRRVHAWREALAPLGLAIAQKVGLELGNGPPDAGTPRF